MSQYVGPEDSIRIYKLGNDNDIASFGVLNNVNLEQVVIA